MRRAFFLAGALAVLACSEPVSFPTQPPAPHLAMRSEPEPPPVPKGVAKFETDPETKPRIAMIVGISAIAFIVALVIARSMRAIDRFIPAGIAAAFLGPVVALLTTARRLAHLLVDLASTKFFFAGFAMKLWNENQPLLMGLYCGSILLIVVLLIAAFKKSDGERGGVATVWTLLFAIIAAAVSFVSFITLDRLLLAILDPIATDALPRSFRSISFAGAARLGQVRMIMALSVAAIAILLLLLAFIFAFVMRGIRGQLLIALLALIVMLCAAAVDWTWSEALEASARSGHVPDTILTR